ncbi:histidine phosphatase family protein [Enterovirga aerilata]|uniref:histidine phosphatase family protein n=1 Tax=Enterovirga aerilata TaxID=2730920 RepID=UPI003211CFB1
MYFVRHGETDWNAAARLQGQQDIPLNPVGRVQAEEAGRKLALLVPDPAALDYVASPLGRTRETMEILRRTLGLDPAGYRMDGRFVELTFGSWEGLTWREVRGREAALAAARERDKWNFVPPGGESYAMLLHRLLPAARELSRPTVLVSHGGVARALLAGLCGVPVHEAPRVDIWQGRILVFEHGRHCWT